MIAIVPLLYAIQSLAGNNYRRFFVLSVLGGLFHYSVLVVVPIMMILRPAKINIYLIMLIIISISVLRIIGLTGILGFLNLAGSNYLVDRLSRYILNNFRPKTIDYAKMFIMIFFIIFSYKYLKDNRYWQLWVKSYFVYILLFLSFGDYEIVYRISMYFELSITLIIPLVIKETIFMNDSKILFYFLSCFTLIFSILYRITSFDDGHFLDYKFFFAK
jgi:hypothetical protein